MTRTWSVVVAVVAFAGVAGAAPLEPPDRFGIDVGAHLRLQVGDDTGRHDQWPQLDKVTISLVKNGKTVWTKRGWTGLTDKDAATVPAAFRAAPCKLFDLHVYPQKLDKRDGVRLSLECKNHDMTHTDEEIVVATDILVDTAEPYHVLYVGDGTGYDDGGACDRVHVVTYALTGKALAITATDRRGTGCANPGTTTTTSTVEL